MPENNNIDLKDMDPFSKAEVGMSSSFIKTVSESDVYLYAGITGDFSPNHVDAEFMEKGAYGERVAHGTLMLGFMSAASARMYLGRTVSQGYDRVRFLKPVRFGDTITTIYKVSSIDSVKKKIIADVTCTNQRGELVAVATNIRVHIG
ncbi:MaoC family dehydratase [Polynucleobacter sp. AP-Melu-500A-A1]|uniref:MaoC family dehydratase n=1 Tax=Polynucleobacter sp. AP-Melu-500A-A1 TaxID=2576929 RepID=UPI0021069EC6|nr:MaoC family dehydratase [Polynucleobacter sp. AP-Melu-500A-A1]